MFDKGVEPTLCCSCITSCDMIHNIALLLLPSLILVIYHYGITLNQRFTSSSKSQNTTKPDAISTIADTPVILLSLH